MSGERDGHPADGAPGTAAAAEAPPYVCPALGCADDPGSHDLRTTETHRCYAGPRRRPVPLDHQRRFCLSVNYVRCPLWLESPRAIAPPPGAAAKNGATAAGDEARVPAVRRLRVRALALAGLLAVVVLALVGGTALALLRRGSTGGKQAAQAGALAPAATPAQPAPAAPGPPRAAADVPDSALLRPGAALSSRVNVSLDGSPTGQALIVSRLPVAGGCDRWFLDLFSYNASTGAFADVFDAITARASDGSALLPSAAVANGRCLPQIDLVAATQLEGGAAPVALAAIREADGSERLLALALRPGQQQASVTFDQVFPAGATVRLSADAAQVEVAQLASGPSIPGLYAPADGPVGVVVQRFGGQNTGLHDLGARFQPSCSAGAVGVAATSGGKRWLRVECQALGVRGRSVFVVSPVAPFTPAGTSWDTLEPGDLVTLTLDPNSQLGDTTESATATAMAVRVDSALPASPTPGPALPPGLAPTAVINSGAPAIAPAPLQSVSQPAPVAPAPAPAAPPAAAPVAPVPAVAPADQPAPYTGTDDSSPAPAVAVPAAPVATAPPPAPTEPPAPSGGLAPPPASTQAPSGGGGLAPPPH